MNIVGLPRGWLGVLSCFALLGAHRAAFAQSSPSPSSGSLGAAESAAPASAGPAPTPIAPKAQPEPLPTHASRLPAFVALGVGGATLGGAVITGIIANADYNDAKSSCSPACRNSELTPGRTLALASTILSAVAVVGIGVGVTLLLASGPDPAQMSLAPALRLAAAPTAARATATWSF